MTSDNFTIFCVINMRFNGLFCVSFVLGIQFSYGLYISNLNDACVRCLCHVTGCDTTHTCTGGYCGPFYISRVYWTDAGRPTLPADDPERPEAFEDCARDYHCSIKIIQAYMAKFGKDCNGDGVTNCYDYMMINHNGGQACSQSLETTKVGRGRIKLFQECRLRN